MTKICIKTRSGSVLALVMFLTFLLFVLTSVIGQNVIQNSSSTSKTMDSKRSRYAAYSGLQLALATLNHKADRDYAVAAPVTLTGSMPDSPAVSFSVTLRNNIYGDLPADVVPVGAVQIDSRAKYRDGVSNREIGGLVGNAVQFNPSFDQAIYGNAIQLAHNSQSLAFDFNKYKKEMRNDSSYDTDTSVQDTQWGSGAKVVCSSSMIAVEDASKIHGDVAYQEAASTTVSAPTGIPIRPVPAPSASGPQLVQGVDYTGKKVAASASALPAVRPPYDKSQATVELTDFTGTPIKDRQGNVIGYEPVQFEPGAYKNVTVPAGQTATLKPGTYYFAENFVVGGNLMMDTWGSEPTIIYVGKKMVVGGLINDGGKPERLQTYFTDEDNTPDPGETVATPDKFKVSRLIIDGGRATMTAGGSKLRTKLDHNAQLLGSLISDVAIVDNGSKVKFDSNLAGQSTLMKSEWKLTGIRER